MKYLVVGGGGFIGTHLSNLLISQGHQVTVYDTQHSRALDKNIAFANFRMEDLRFLESEVRRADFVIHLAATVGVKRTMDSTNTLVRNNIDNTDNLFTICVAYDKPVFFASTSEVYGKSENVPLRESQNIVLGPPDTIRWSYAYSKAIGESLASYYAVNHNLKYVTGRIFNSVGPGQVGTNGMVIPRMIESAKNNERVQVYGSGLQTRSFCHVQDTVAGIKAVMDNGKQGEAYNIGSGNEISMIHLAEKIIQQTRSSSPISLVPYADAYGPGYEDTIRRVPSIEKIKDHTGWQPTKTIEDIIGELV